MTRAPDSGGEESSPPHSDDPEPRVDLTESMALFRRFRADGDAGALAALFRRYRGRLSRKVSIMMSSRVRSRYEASDIVQSAFARGFANIDRFEFREEASLIRWLSTIALNSIRNKAKEARRRDAADLDAVAELELVDLDRPCSFGGQPIEALEAAERTELVDRAMTRVAEDHRTVLLLRLYDGGSWSYVAEQMGRSENAVQKLYPRAKAALAAELPRGLFSSGAPGE